VAPFAPTSSLVKILYLSFEYNSLAMVFLVVGLVIKLFYRGYARWLTKWPLGFLEK